MKGKKIAKIVSVTIEWIKKQLEISINLIHFSKNPAIIFINRQTYPCKIKQDKEFTSPLFDFRTDGILCANSIDL